MEIHSDSSSDMSEEILDEIVQQASQELFKDVRVGENLIIKGDIIQKVIQNIISLVIFSRSFYYLLSSFFTLFKNKKYK